MGIVLVEFKSMINDGMHVVSSCESGFVCFNVSEKLLDIESGIRINSGVGSEGLPSD